MSNDNEVSCPKCGSGNHKGIYFRTCLDCGTYYNKDGARIGSDGKQCNSWRKKSVRVLFGTALGLTSFVVFLAILFGNISRIGMSGTEHLMNKMAISIGCMILSVCIALPKKLKHALLAVSIMIAIVALIFGARYIKIKTGSSKKSSTRILSAQQCSVLVVHAVKSNAPGASGILFDIKGDDPDNFKAQGSFKRSGVKYIFKTWLKNGNPVYFVADPY